MFDLIWDATVGFLFSRLIAVRPAIKFRSGQLMLCSDWRTAMWTLGAWNRQITIDRQLEEIRIRQRTFWLWIKRRIVRFDQIEQILYGYFDLNPASSFSFVAYQSDDVFTIGLRLKSGEGVKLCKFFGEGGFVYNGVLPDWFYWEDAARAAITQVDQSGSSLDMADMLSRMIGVPIGSPEFN